MQEENSQKVKIFSRRLRGLRSNIGMTQSELAAKLGLSLGTVGNWEAERNMPQGPLMRKLGEFFNVPVSFLMGEGPEHYPDGNGKQAGDVPGRAVLKQGANYYNAADGEDVGELSEDPEAFLVEMFGDAMEPKILAMDRLVVSPNAKVESGDLVMVKKTRRRNHGARLHRRGQGGDLSPRGLQSDLRRTGMEARSLQIHLRHHRCLAADQSARPVSRGQTARR